jgi:hypothetical protein
MMTRDDDHAYNVILNVLIPKHSTPILDLYIVKVGSHLSSVPSLSDQNDGKCVVHQYLFSIRFALTIVFIFQGIHHNMKLLCKCHGVSGSCSIKICWRTMPSFRTIGGFLKERFDGASKVKINKKQTKLRPVSRRQKRPTKKDLVYLEESPDYCNFNPTHGSMGTTGRQCNQTSIGLDGCKLMCCGRGYYTIVRDIKEDCDCKFFWCCRVVCKKCTKVIEEHFCNWALTLIITSTKIWFDSTTFLSPI